MEPLTTCLSKAAQTLTLSATPPDLANSSVVQQALRCLGGTPDKPASIERALEVARRVVGLADHAEIERVIRVLMVTKGKTYSQVVEKNLGQQLETGLDLLGIDKMLLDMQITRDELDAIFQMANRTKWTHTGYTPLPEVADWAQMLKEHREKNTLRWSLAHDLIKANDDARKLPEPMSFTPAKLKASLALGLWPLMFDEHREAVWMLLEWTELNREAIDGFWQTLTPAERKRIARLATPTERGLATQKLFEQQYGRNTQEKKKKINK